MIVALAPKTRTVIAASCTTGASDVPADTMATVPRGRGRSPYVAAQADLVDDRVGELFAEGGQGIVTQPGREHAPVGVGISQPGEEVDDLGRCLPGAVDDFGVAGPVRAADIEACVPEVEGGVPGSLLAGSGSPAWRRPHPESQSWLKLSASSAEARWWTRH